MRVAPAGRAGVSRGGETPYAVAPRNLVREPALGKPVEHAVKGHAVDIVAAAQAALDLVVRQRLVGAEQRGEYFDAGARLARPVAEHAAACDGGIGAREAWMPEKRCVRSQAIIAPACGVEKMTLRDTSCFAIAVSRSSLGGGTLPRVRELALIV